jgi:large subunit ribosomal protein L5
MSRLKDRYDKEVAPALQKEFGYKNVMAIPKVKKVVVNMGLGEATQNAKIVDTGVDELARVTGQKPVVTRAKKSIAQFKVRKGMPIGTMVTLRGPRMWDFLDRLMAVALPRVRDFRACRPGIRRSRATHARPEGPAAVPGDRLHEGRQGAWDEHLGRDDGIDRRGIHASCQLLGMPFRALTGPQDPALRPSNVNSGLLEDGTHKEQDGHDCEDRQGSEDPQVQGPAAQPLQALRASACLPAKVRAVPAVLPQAGAGRRYRGRDEE